MSLTPPQPPKPPTHCQAAAASWSTSQFSEELATLLHSRLRLVTLIALVPLFHFFFRELTDPQRGMTSDAFGLVLHGVVAAFLATTAGFLWTRGDLQLLTLRRIELAVFLSMMLFFGWTQLTLMGETEVYTVAGEAPHLGIVQLWISNSAMRWFFLIVIYGVFIPNTWVRCARLTGVTAVLPLVLTPVGAYWHGHLGGSVWSSMLDLAIVMATGFAIAVFGAYRLQTLSKEAFQARRLGQYRLCGRIGAGGMGEVYEAEHVLLRRRCAMKLIREDQMDDPRAFGRFEREVRAMATLTHWNTVEVYDYGRTDDGTFYYVMEYLDGLNLEVLVNRHGPLPVARAIHFLRQVCDALREAHGTGLMHRDIKPSNVMACQRGGVYDVTKLLDFGLVQEMRPASGAAKLTVAGTVVGSPPYMSPEQAMGRQDVDPRSDIYSLGAVGYYLLTGQPPFPRETSMEMLLAHAYEPPSPPSRVRPDLPEDIQAVIMRCLSKKTKERYQCVDDLSRDLGRCADAGAWGEEQAAAWWEGINEPEKPAAPKLAATAR